MFKRILKHFFYRLFKEELEDLDDRFLTIESTLFRMEKERKEKNGWSWKNLNN